MKKLQTILLMIMLAFASCEKEPQCNDVVKDLTTKQVSSNPTVIKHYVTYGPKRETAGVTVEISSREFNRLRVGDPYCH